MQIKTHSTRVVALLTGGVIAAATLFQPAPAQAATKSKNLKYGAVGLGVLGAYLLTKGKTVGGAAALAGGAYAYEKGRNNQKDDNRGYRYPDYRSYNGNNGNGPRYDSHAEYRDYGDHNRNDRDRNDRDRNDRDRNDRDQNGPGCRDDQRSGYGQHDNRDNRYDSRDDNRYDNRDNGRDDRRDNRGGGHDLSPYLR